MSARRNALGRGLGALIPDEPAPPVAIAPAREEREAGGLLELPVGSIAPNPDQPRRLFDEDELQKLADSIGRHGVLQPVVVRQREDAGYELIVGERRWRASQLAGRETIPAVVREQSEPALLEIALVENVQRHDLNPMELAHAFRELIERGHTQEDVGRRVGLDRSTISNALRLLELPGEFQADVELGRLSGGHAKALLQLQSPERRRLLRDRVVAESLSVRATEELARSLGGPGRRRKSPRRPDAVDPDTQRLLDQLRDRLQTRVKLSGTPKKGRLEVEFYGPEELGRIARAILDGR
ncbi:MAG: ParB/RepB/Spo0J family partition protein [Myxococcota bacterium]